MINCLFSYGEFRTGVFEGICLLMCPDIVNERKTNMTSAGDHLSRRKWLGLTSGSIATGMIGGAAFSDSGADSPRREAVARGDRLPREVWVASISQNNLTADNPKSMMRMMLARMEQTLPYEPDIICLPEVFHVANQPGSRPPLSESAESPVGEISRPFAEFAKKHHCHVVCPIYTVEKGRYYNAALFLDRSGKPLGEYRKIHPTIGEMERGITPGPLDPPVFETDFGRVGAQICFDIEWPDGWEALGRKGAEIVFWPSAFFGGAMVSQAACRYDYCVVSSTRKGTTRICDLMGEEVAATGHFDQWICAPINLEKALLHTWPFCQRFGDIRAKYGRKIRIRTFHEEEWTVLESRSPELKIRDILDEFEIKTRREHIQAADKAQIIQRP